MTCEQKDRPMIEMQGPLKAQDVEDPQERQGRITKKISIQVKDLLFPNCIIYK